MTPCMRTGFCRRTSLREFDSIWQINMLSTAASLRYKSWLHFLCRCSIIINWKSRLKLPGRHTAFKPDCSSLFVKGADCKGFRYRIGDGNSALCSERLNELRSVQWHVSMTIKPPKLLAKRIREPIQQSLVIEICRVWHEPDVLAILGGEVESRYRLLVLPRYSCNSHSHKPVAWSRASRFCPVCTDKTHEQMCIASDR